MTQQEAAEKAVRTVYQAVIAQDLDRLKSISPLCRNWGDEFLRKIVLKPDKEDRIVEIVRSGRSAGQDASLGPYRGSAYCSQAEELARRSRSDDRPVPSVRGESSCVVHGPYGCRVR
jgi:hypothetical protein